MDINHWPIMIKFKLIPSIFGNAKEPISEERLNFNKADWELFIMIFLIILIMILNQSMNLLVTP